MDQFKIGKVFKEAIKKEEYKTSHKGFTHSILEEVKDGDVVIFDNERQGKRFKQLLKEKSPSIQADICVQPPTDIGMLNAKVLGVTKKVFFDNGWVTLYYKTKLSKAIADFAKFSYGKTKEEDPVAYFSIDITEVEDGLKVYSIEEINDSINKGTELQERTIKYLNEDSGHIAIYCFAENDEYGIRFFVNRFVKKEDLKTFLFYYTNNAEPEISLCDYFAAHALNGMLSTGEEMKYDGDLAEFAYAIADKMLEQRNK